MNPKGRPSKNLDFSRNTFTISIRTDDALAKQIRTFCKENKCNKNQFIKTVLKNYFNDELKTTIKPRKLVRVSYFNSRKGG
tara:strand:+ start:1405 stop:1647 length:243 start_codon:yes stop_codon:yes gene_type:complete